MAATKYIETGLVLILAAMLMRGATAQTGCSSTIMSLASCLIYVTGNTTTPSSSCCSSLSSVVQSQPQCLCPLLNGGGPSFGISINQTLALALPAICNVQTPPVARCSNSAGGPATAPAPSPVSPPTDGSSTEPDEDPTTTVPSIPSDNAGTGSKTVPNTSGSTSDGSSVTTSIQLMMAFTLSIAVWTANAVKF